MDRRKEIKHLLYLKRQLIIDTKKEIKMLQRELDTINGYKTLQRKFERNRRK